MIIKVIAADLLVFIKKFCSIRCDHKLIVFLGDLRGTSSQRYLIDVRFHGGDSRLFRLSHAHLQRENVRSFLDKWNLSYNIPML